MQPESGAGDGTVSHRPGIPLAFNCLPGCLPERRAGGHGQQACHAGVGRVAQRKIVRPVAGQLSRLADAAGIADCGAAWRVSCDAFRNERRRIVMVAMKRIGTISALVVLVIASVLGRYAWPRFPSPPSGREAEAFVRQNALRYKADEICGDYRRWPVVYDFDAPMYTQTKYTLALMEAMAGVGFVTRKAVQSRNAGPVQFYLHEKRICDIAPRAKPYVRERPGRAGALRERQELVAAVELGYRREVNMKGTGECET